MEIQQLQQLSNSIALRLDNPKSVKLQVRQINLAQKQLRFFKKEINAAIRAINQNASQSNADSIVSVGLDLFGKRRWAGSVRAETRRQIEREKRDARQPYLDIKDDIDRIILEGDRLKMIAENYLLNKS
jgi:hypothetical protein